MSTQKANHQSPQELIEVLRTTGLQMRPYLFSRDAKRRWQELETELNALRSSVEHDGEQIGESTAARLRELTQAVTAFLDEVDRVFDLATAVRKLMKVAVSCSPDDSLNRPAQIMREVDCGAVPVVDSDGAVVGMITDRDLCMAAYTRDATSGAMTVDSVMSKQISTCDASDSIGHAVRIMAEKQVRRLPVIEDGRLVGLVSVADIAQRIAGQRTKHVLACLAFADAMAAITAKKSMSRPHVGRSESHATPSPRRSLEPGWGLLSCPLLPPERPAQDRGEGWPINRSG